MAEFDAPEVLLSDKSTRFYSMALEAGLVKDGEEQAIEKEVVGKEVAN